MTTVRKVIIDVSYQQNVAVLKVTLVTIDVLITFINILEAKIFIINMWNLNTLFVTVYYIVINEGH